MIYKFTSSDYFLIGHVVYVLIVNNVIKNEKFYFASNLCEIRKKCIFQSRSNFGKIWITLRADFFNIWNFISYVQTIGLEFVKSCMTNFFFYFYFRRMIFKLIKNMQISDFWQKHFLLWKKILMFDQRKLFMDELVELSC